MNILGEYLHKSFISQRRVTPSRLVDEDFGVLEVSWQRKMVFFKISLYKKYLIGSLTKIKNHLENRCLTVVIGFHSTVSPDCAVWYFCV